MCGIAGLVGGDFVGGGPQRAKQIVEAMTGAIAHRGPDGAGVWSGDGAVMGHRRLSIIDLTSAGDQPMISADGRWVLCFNGEIYNHQDLRKRLDAAGQAPPWIGHSDTEPLLAAIAAWGPAQALCAAHGMFALAAWDRRERRLILARDRFGEKPLYFGKVARALAFTSELKALHAIPGFDAPIDPCALRSMLGRGYVTPDRSIYHGIAQVGPGCWVEIAGDGEVVARHRYYDYAAIVEQGTRTPISDPREALDRLRMTLGAAVARQMVADVAVGTLLSGGIDSSLITAVAVRHASGAVRTYSIGFADAGFDEAPMARRVAEHLGTDHHERYVSAEDALAVIPQLPTMFDEPFGDSSQIPTAIVSRFAREDLIVALTGDGGDELFGGYRRHSGFPQLWRRLASLPVPLRRELAGLAGAIPPQVWNRLATVRSGSAAAPFFGHKVQRSLAIAGEADSFAGFADAFLDEWHGWPSPVCGHGSPRPLAGFSGAIGTAEQLMLADALAYLPGDILTKVDRAAMAVSLEGRVPFLDPEVADLAACIPLEQKIDRGTGKLILRRLLHEMVPRELVERPKTGFAIPLAAWLRGPLRDWAEGLLAPAELMRSGQLDPAPIRARWLAHCEGRIDASQALWSVLSFQAWHTHWHAPRASAND